LSAPATIFGPVVTGGDVEQWCLDLLRKWSGTYLSELERQHGYVAGTLQRVRAWLTAPSFDKWPEDQLPAVVLVSVGLMEPPLREGDGRYRGRWGMSLGVVCSARTQELSHEQSMLYLAAHRAILLQRPSLEGHAAGISWLDEDYTSLPYDDVRSLGAGTAAFSIEVRGITLGDAGPVTPDDPLAPDTAPWPDWPTADTVDVTVGNVPPPQPLPTKGGRK
jgi:hypothetical protein